MHISAYVYTRTHFPKLYKIRIRDTFPFSVNISVYFSKNKDILHSPTIKIKIRTFLVVQWVTVHLPYRGRAWQATFHGVMRVGHNRETKHTTASQQGAGFNPGLGRFHVYGQLRLYATGTSACMPGAYTLRGKPHRNNELPPVAASREASAARRLSTANKMKQMGKKQTDTRKESRIESLLPSSELFQIYAQLSIMPFPSLSHALNFRKTCFVFCFLITIKFQNAAIKEIISRKDYKKHRDYVGRF